MSIEKLLGLGKYQQSAKKDVWLPVLQFGVAAIVKTGPFILIAIEAILIGRAFGPLFIAVALYGEFINARTAAEEKETGVTLPRVNTAWPWAIAAGFTAMLAFGVWLVPETALQYCWPFIQRRMLKDVTGLGAWWSIGGAAFEPMGSWLAWRFMLVAAMAYASPEPWRALVSRSIVEIVAPMFAESINVNNYKNIEKGTEGKPRTSAPPEPMDVNDLF